MFSFLCASIEDADDRDYMLWLYNKFERLMFSVAEEYLPNRPDREDVIQDCLIKLIQKIHMLRQMEQRSLAGYIAITVRNTSINRLKYDTVRNSRSASLDECGERADMQVPALDELMVLMESKSQLHKIWPKLTEQERIILEMKYILGYNDEEIAKQFKCKPGSVRMKLTRARRAALKLLSDETEGDKVETL